VVTEERRKVIVLGSTGSIGTQALEVIQGNRHRFDVVGLAAGANQDLAYAQAEQLGLARERVVFGARDAAQLVRDVAADVVLNGITGSVGLVPTLAVLQTGATLALANKESLIVGGELVLEARHSADQIVPVDSEHSALAQALMAGKRAEVAKMILTASGGPFRGKDASSLRAVTPAQALAHPTWDMGPVVTTNSATMVNKGLEVIETHLLFGVPYSAIEVTVHPQSVVHSLVEFHDGSTVAQASPPDIRLSLAWGLSWPERVPGVIQGIDWSSSHTWTFEPLDEEVFPAVSMARAAGAKGATFPAAFNAANEQGVYAFHRGEITLPGIIDVISHVLDAHSPQGMTVEGVVEAERWARDCADTYIARIRS